MNGLQLGREPWKAAAGRESFPMCLGQRRETVASGQVPSLSAASVLGAAARLLPLCSPGRHSTFPRHLTRMVSIRL